MEASQAVRVHSQRARQDVDGHGPLEARIRAALSPAGGRRPARLTRSTQALSAAF
jgi:hypothetical protein